MTQNRSINIKTPALRCRPKPQASEAPTRAGPTATCLPHSGYVLTPKGFVWKKGLENTEKAAKRVLSQKHYLLQFSQIVAFITQHQF